MSRVIRNTPEGSRTVMPMEPIMDSTLSLAAKGAYAELVVNKGVVEGNDDATNAAISELIEHGYIKEITGSCKKGDM